MLDIIIYLVHLIGCLMVISILVTISTVFVYSLIVIIKAWKPETWNFHKNN